MGRKRLDRRDQRRIQAYLRAQDSLNYALNHTRTKIQRLVAEGMDQSSAEKKVANYISKSKEHILDLRDKLKNDGLIS